MNLQSSEWNLFVYGSMCTGMVHFERIQDLVLAKQDAAVRSRVYRLPVGFPVLIDDPLHWVSGQLLTMKASTTLIAMLDEMHGFTSDFPEKCLFFRKEAEVFDLTGNLSARAFVYFMNPKHLPKKSKLIEDGDWRRSMLEKPTLVEQLNERQRAYIRRLGTVSGREIVPVDLQLYRELMNLELIVDKGRRLALSKLGHEVLRHLN